MKVAHLDEPAELSFRNEQQRQGNIEAVCPSCKYQNWVHKPERVSPRNYRRSGYYCHDHGKCHDFKCEHCGASLTPSVTTSHKITPEIKAKAEEVGKWMESNAGQKR
jgi:hypothetical protein